MCADRSSIDEQLLIRSLVFWDVALCSHVEVDRRFVSAYCLHHQGDEMLANFVTTRRYIREDSKLHTCRRENMKSHFF
jgi:hypothetical protein